MRLTLCLIAGLIISGQTTGLAQIAGSAGTKIKATLIKNSYNGSRETAELSAGPDALERGGAVEMMAGAGCELTQGRNARLTPEEDKQYGAWNRMGLANAHLGRIVSETLRAGSFPVGLLANCNSLMGMLAGVQHSGRGNRPLKVGLVWIDAHGDFNTPETTLSGMLGGMPVSVSAGLCLTRFRLQSGLDPALPFNYIVMLGVRDTDPLEQELLDRHRIEMISAKEIVPPFSTIHDQMKRLDGIVDLVYVHIDMDVLDPAEVSGHSLNVAGGPTSQALGDSLAAFFSYPKAVALGIASYPAERDENKASLKAAYRLIEGAIRGVKQVRRSGRPGPSAVKDPIVPPGS